MILTPIRLDKLLLFIGAALLPIYPFGSGGFQPTHAVFALFVGITLFTRGIPLTSWSLLLAALFMHSLMIESIYIILDRDPKFIINSVFFLYNFIFVCAVYQYVLHDGLSMLVPGIMVATAIALVTLLISGVDLRELGDGGRSTGTFNNPNQLGYFSVCLLSLAYLFYHSKSIGYWLAIVLFAVSTFLAVSSLSKAAMIANFIVIFLVLKPRSSPSAVIGWLIAALAASAVLLRLFQGGFFDEYLFVERLLNMANESDSSLASRGYFAFLQGNTLQVMFGLGAQGVDDIVGHEVHSTFGSVMNNYGIIGFLIFFTACSVWGIRLFQNYGFAGLVCLVAPAMLYGITHNGIRFTIFWLLFAASMAMAERNARECGTRNEGGHKGLKPPREIAAI